MIWTVYHTAIHSIASSHVFRSLITQNIDTGSVALFSAAIENKIKRIIFCSSMARYGTNRVPFESFTPNPQDPYGIEKDREYFKKFMRSSWC